MIDTPRKLSHPMIMLRRYAFETLLRFRLHTRRPGRRPLAQNSYHRGRQLSGFRWGMFES